MLIRAPRLGDQVTGSTRRFRYPSRVISSASLNGAKESFDHLLEDDVAGLAQFVALRGQLMPTARPGPGTRSMSPRSIIRPASAPKDWSGGHSSVTGDIRNPMRYCHR